MLSWRSFWVCEWHLFCMCDSLTVYQEHSDPVSGSRLGQHTHSQFISKWSSVHYLNFHSDIRSFSNTWVNNADTTIGFKCDHSSFIFLSSKWAAFCSYLHTTPSGSHWTFLDQIKIPVSEKCSLYVKKQTEKILKTEINQINLFSN